MDILIFLVLLMILPGNAAGNSTSMHFMGGSMSFRFIDTSKPIYKVKLTLVTGWILGQGPCGTTCRTQDIGRNTTNSRKNMLAVNGAEYFGKWDRQISTLNHPRTYDVITNQVNNKFEGHVAAVNVPMKWEQDVEEVTLDLDPSILRMELNIFGSYWRTFNYTWGGWRDYPALYYLTVTVPPTPREDTEKPNNSPVAMFKPVYKILLNKATTIRFSTMDPDGDAVRCYQYPFEDDLGTLNNTVINPDCSIVIDAQESAGFVDGGWGAIPIQVMDIPTKPEVDQTPVDLELRRMAFRGINVETLKTVSAPEFVDPTEESQHEFVVHVGSTLKIQLYAKPVEYSTSDIDAFYLRSIPFQTFHVDAPKNDTARLDEHVKYSIATWRPGKSDVGDYVVGALVTDTQGYDGHDRNYNVIVKDIELLAPKELPHTGPYFSLVPHVTGIVCIYGSTCFFPIYTNTKTPSDYITSVKYTTSTFPITTISPPEQAAVDGVSMYVSEVTIQASKDGDQSICFEATDNHRRNSEIKCMTVKVELPNPCKLNTCGRGLCISQGKTYKCICGMKQTGQHCEKDLNFCTSKPCLNNGQCIKSDKKLYECDCAGTGYFGINCEKDIVDCKLGVCGPHGVCKDLKRKFECDCFSGYSGDTCQQIDNKCQGVVCNNNGICIVEGGVGVCKCQLGFSGPDCASSHVTPQVNGGTKSNPFTVPSLPNGAELQCFVNIPCFVSLYSETTSGSPDIKVGLHSSDVTASIPSTSPDPTTGTVKSLLSITANKTGVHTVCVTSGRRSIDTLCYNIRTSIYKHLAADKQMVPTFAPPTPPNHSIINCLEDRDCHVIITTSYNKNCTLFSGSTSAIVFEVMKSGKKCETDVLFNPPATGDKEVCLHAGPQFTVEGISFQGEKRCFILKTATTDSCNPNPCNGGACILQPGETIPYQCICPGTYAGDTCQYNYCNPNPCTNGGTCVRQPEETPFYKCMCPDIVAGDICQYQKSLCNNGGFLEPQGDTYVCRCPIGYGGRNCDPNPTSTEAEFTDPTLNNGATVECEVGAKCVIPVRIQGPSAQLFEGPSSGDVNIKLWKRIGKAGAFHNDDMLEITARTPGDMNVCLKTQTMFSSSNKDICYHIKASTETTAMENDDFIFPTLPAETTIPCAKTKQCHILMYIQPDQNNCQQVEGQGDMNVHIFPSKLEGGSCITDVLFSSDVSTGLQDLCLRVGSSNQRCYKVDSNPAEPCKNQNCGAGACIVEGDNYACVCDGKHQGIACNSDIAVPVIG